MSTGSHPAATIATPRPSPRQRRGPASCAGRRCLTKSGNLHLRTQLVESACAYQHGPSVGVELRRRQEGLPPETVARAWAAQARLCGKFRRLAQKKNSKNVVATAVARQLCGSCGRR